MRLGHKQQRIFDIIEEKGYVTLKDFEDVYNLNQQKAINKLKEFISMNWIKRIEGYEMPLRYKNVK